MRIARLTVDRNYDWSMPVKAQRHDPGQRTVDEAEADPLASVNRFIGRHDAVGRNGVPDAARHPRFHHVAEPGRDLPVRPKPPIHDHPHQLTVEGRRFPFLDDQRAASPRPSC